MKRDWLHSKSWLGELRSLGTEPKGRNSLNDNEEIDSLIENIKQTLYQEYKTVYSESFKGI
jgi:hypothetical protein